MNFKELYEGVEPTMPGAPKGIQIMTPQQFVAKAGDMPGEESGEQGVAEGLNDTIYPNAEVIKSKNGKPVGEIYQDGNYWGAFHYRADRGYDFIDSREEAIEALKDLHQETGRSRPDYTIKGVAEGSEQITEYRDRLLQYVKSLLPTWPEYVLKDWLVPNKGDFSNLPDTELKNGIMEKLKGAGLTTNSKWQLVPNMKFTMDMFDPKTKQLLIGRAGGSSDLGMGIPKDKERHATQAALAQQQGGVRKEPVLLIKSANGYELLEGWHRTIQHFVKYPEGYTGPAYVVAQGPQGVAEGQDHLTRIRKLSGLAEATTLPASTRELKGQEFQDYMNRIKGTDDIDKKTGQVKLDKKGNEKYVTGKTKGDKYKMPYIHRSSIIEYLGPDGKTYDEDKIKKSLSQRPKALLKQNEKMKHSNGEFEQFFNVGFAALTGIAVDEQTDNLIIVNTCPGAGSCKVDCFAMKGGKVQFKAAWQSDGRILTYLLNDPDGFFNQLSGEISKEESLGQKGDKKFPNGWKTTIRWHDAGDFFSPEYLDMALKMAAKHPDTKFYAYTKMAGAALAQKPPNFIINWSEGANTSQEKQVKATDANLDKTKNSRIVPDDLFQDLLVKDEKKNLVKGESGQWQVQPDKLPELKQRLASEYGLSANSILSYDEYMAKRKSIPQGMKYNVIVAPGEGDISANDPNIISTLLLRH